MSSIKKFYSPHPGHAGAAIPIPAKVKAVADELDGQEMTIEEAITKIETVTDGEVNDVANYNYISLKISGR